VLYVDGVGPFGGASRSLFEALRALPEGSVEKYFLAVEGTVMPYYRQVARDVVAMPGLTRFDNSRYGYYRGARWLVVLREVAHLPWTLIGLWTARRRWRHAIDLVHVNEVTEILPAVFAKKLLRAPLVVHVRSLQRVDEGSWRCRFMTWLLGRYADAIISIDENVRSTLPRDLTVDVIHNSFTPRVAAKPDPALLSKLESLRPGSLKVGFVGNLHRSKGVFELVEATKLARNANRDIEVLMVGGATRPERGLRAWLLKRLGLWQDAQADVSAAVEASGLGDAIHFLGHTPDIQRIYERIDVLCFPSHFDAPGRPVFEAAFSSVPSIVAVTNPRRDTLVPGETGLAVPGKDVRALADALMYCADQREEVRRMGANARELARRNFVPQSNAAVLLALYQRVLSGSRVCVAKSAVADPLEP